MLLAENLCKYRMHVRVGERKSFCYCHGFLETQIFTSTINIYHRCFLTKTMEVFTKM